jgi:hypothetical protein
MSTMLATTNPAAADRIAPATAPGVGGSVVFVPRPGEQRMGRNEFPAMVLFKHDDLTLDLLVFYGAEDQGERLRTRAWSEDEPYHCWKHVQGAEPEKFEPSRLNKMREDLEALRAQVFGDWKVPAKPLIEFLVQFEGDVKAFRTALKARKE